MKDRIRQLMESQHMTQQTFAQFIEMSPASLSSIFNGRTKPTLNTVEAIRKKIPTISIEWLMFGKEPMFLDDVGGKSAPEPAHDGMGDLFSSVENKVSSPVQEQGVNVSKENSGTQKPSSKDEVLYVERAARQITEIRVFFDDQTYESFTPKKS